MSTKKSKSPKAAKNKDSKYKFSIGDNNFTIKGINYKQANKVRLFVLSGIKVTAISHIYVLENSSLLTNEQLKFRLTETPIYYPPDEELPEERAILKITPSGKIPSHVDKDNLVNVDEYMEAVVGKKVSFVTTDYIKFPDDKFIAREALIAILTTGQALNIQISFTRGYATGEDSVRFSCVETIDMDIDKNLSNQDLAILIRDKDSFTFTVVATLDSYFPYICKEVKKFINQDDF
jgi:hypothetical protein